VPHSVFWQAIAFRFPGDRAILARAIPLVLSADALNQLAQVITGER
jgi:hypothetical protein